MDDELEGFMSHSVKVLMIHNSTAEQDQVDVSIVIEGIQVLTGSVNRTKACILLMGLIYALNLEYPSDSTIHSHIHITYTCS